MSKSINIVEDIMSANDQLAVQNRAMLNAHDVLGLNIMASPGAGKTSTILRTIEAITPQIQVGVVEGDTAAVTIDADKITAAGCPAIQINTGGSCHLDAVMLAKALPKLPLDDLDLLIVENVGNLICPAAFSIGTHANVAIASIPEGDDKPYKYPNIYRGIDALILNKMDLRPYIDFDQTYFERGIRLLNPNVAIFPISCKTGEGMAAWAEWIQRKVG